MNLYVPAPRLLPDGLLRAEFPSEPSSVNKKVLVLSSKEAPILNLILVPLGPAMEDSVVPPRLEMYPDGAPVCALRGVGMLKKYEATPSSSINEGVAAGIVVSVVSWPVDIARGLSGGASIVTGKHF